MRPNQRPSADQTNAPAPGKWKRRLLCVVALLLTLLVLSPLLVARTPLRNWLLTWALSPLNGDIRIGGASLWWWNAPVLTDIEIRDPAGRTLLHVPCIAGSKSLLALLCHPKELGEFRVLKPALHVVCSRDATNLETVLAHWLKKKETPQAAHADAEGFAVSAEFTEASLLVEDEDHGRKWSLDPVNISLLVPPDGHSPLRFQLNAAIVEGGRTGRLTASVAAQRIEGSGGVSRYGVEGELHAEDMPLAVLQPLLRRMEMPIELGGRLNADVKLPSRNGQANEPDVRLEGQASLVDFALHASFLEPDTLKLPRVDVPLSLALKDRRLIVNHVRVQTDVGKVNLAGAVDLAKDWRDALNQAGQQIEAELNLARLAGLLPNALHLAKDTRVQSGSLALNVRSSLRKESVLWEGRLAASNLEGTYEGQHLTWKEPFSLVVTARKEANAAWPLLERFRCEADFLRAEMSGSLEDWTARGNFNLGRLSEHLAGFIELGSLSLQGEGSIRASGRRNPRGGYRLESNAQLTQLKLADGSRVFREDGLSMQLTLVGDSSAAGYRLDAGGLHLLAGEDGIDLDLLEPLANLPALRAVRARMRLHGNLARWRARLASLTGQLEGVHLAGQFEMDGRLRYEADAVQLEDIKVVGRAVELRGVGLCVDEPALDFTTSGRWLPERETLELQLTRFSCPTLSVQTPALTLALDRVGSWQITTSVTIHGDVSRLRRCLLAQSPAQSVASSQGSKATVNPENKESLSGALTGRIDLRPDEGRQVVQLDLNLQNLLLGSPTAPTWRESRVNLAGHGVYDLLKDSFQIAQIHLDSPSLSCDATGQLSALHSDMELSVDGKLSYDLEKLETQLRPFLGQGAKLVGRDSRQFHLAGALAAPSEKPLNLVVSPSLAAPTTGLMGRLHGEAGLSWQRLQAWGCQVGPAALHGQLSGGCFRIAPIEATFNQGRMRLEPSLRLDPLPREVSLAKGRLLDHAHVTPEACASALGYALPVLADVAQAEGELSLDLDGGRIPLADPARAQLSGRLIVHAAQLSAGPLARELSILLSGPATLSLTQNNVVPFYFANGRVYHENLELRFPELTIRTSGSVGMDGSLALMAEMPVPPKWLGSNRIAQSIAGQTIRLPIGGTLSKPKIDEQALRTASAQFARDAAENAIRQELDGKLKKEAENGLRRWFRSRK